MTEATVVEKEIEIEAPADIVFEMLTDAEALCEWMAAEAQTEVVVGGLIRWRHENGAVMSGRFLDDRTADSACVPLRLGRRGTGSAARRHTSSD